MASLGRKRRDKLIAIFGLNCPDCGREMIDSYKVDAPADPMQDRQDFIGRLLTIDHIRPRAKGGKSRLDNLRLCCMDCNKIKGSKFERTPVPVEDEIARLRNFVSLRERLYGRTSEDAEWAVQQGDLRLTAEVGRWLTNWRALNRLLLLSGCT